MWKRPTAYLSVVLGLALACTHGSPAQRAVVTTAPSTPTSTGADKAFVRPCHSSVFGSLGPDWRADATNEGRLHLLYPASYTDAGDRTFRHAPGKLVSLKILVVVDRGSGVTVSVPDDFRSSLALVYDPRYFNRELRAGSGDVSVRFDPCDDSHTTQFNGAIAVATPGCYALVVSSNEGTARLPVPLGEAC
jgi:hypothetical protein